MKHEVRINGQTLGPVERQDIERRAANWERANATVEVEEFAGGRFVALHDFLRSAVTAPAVPTASGSPGGRYYARIDGHLLGPMDEIDLRRRAKNWTSFPVEVAEAGSSAFTPLSEFLAQLPVPPVASPALGPGPYYVHIDGNAPLGPIDRAEVERRAGHWQGASIYVSTSSGGPSVALADFLRSKPPQAPSPTQVRTQPQGRTQWIIAASAVAAVFVAVATFWLMPRHGTTPAGVVAQNASTSSPDGDKPVNTPEAEAEQAYVAGNRAVENEDYPKAVGEYSRALELNPKLTPAYVARGNTNVSLSQFDSAIADYTAALGLDPGYAPAYLSRGTVYWLLGDLERSEQDYRKAIQADPDNSFFYSRLNTILTEQGRGDEIGPVYRQAYDQDHQRNWALGGWLGTFLTKSEYKELLEACAEVEQGGGAGEASATLRFYRGAAEYGLKKYDDAIRDLLKVTELDPEELAFSAYSELAGAYRQIGDAPHCAKYYETFQTLNGRDDELRSRPELTKQFCETRSSIE